MALPVYDADKYHVGLGQQGSEVGLVVSGAFQKSFKRELGDELAAVHYGADSLFNGSGISSWTQDDFTGGGYQQVWGKDPAMFAASGGLLPTQFDRSLRTVAPLTLRADYGGDAHFQVAPLCAFAYAGYLVAFYPDRMMRTNLGSGASDTIFLTLDYSPYTHACFDRRSGKVLATYTGGVGGPGVAVIDPLGSGVMIVGVEPGAANNVGAFTGLDCDGDRLVVASAHVLFTVAMQPNSTDPIGTDWTRVGRLPAPWVDSCWMGQQLYILCGGSDAGASLVAFDTVQVLPVADFPFNFTPSAVCSYAGRIYVGGSGTSISGGQAYGELHEVTGSSVRLVKTFAPELHSGRYGSPSSISALCVHEGLLFFGETGAGLVAYDVTTDALYQAHRFGTDWTPGQSRETVALVSARQRIWPIVVNHTAGAESGLWAGAVSGESVSAFTSYLETSEFGPELDRLKRWKYLRVLTRGDGAGPTVEVSTDGGSTFTGCAQTASAGTGLSVMRTYAVGDVISHSVRFRITLPRTSATSYTELVAFSAAFQLVDSDDVHANGTEKLAWTFAVAGVETVELEDGTADRQRLGELNTQLWTWARSRAPLSFIAPDGERYDVILDSMRETQPIVLPPVERDDPVEWSTDTGREAFYALTLIEA